MSWANVMGTASFNMFSTTFPLEKSFFVSFIALLPPYLLYHTIILLILHPVFPLRAIKPMYS